MSGVDPGKDKRYGQKTQTQFTIPRLAPAGNYGANCDLYLTTVIDLPIEVQLQGATGDQAHLCWKPGTGGILVRGYDTLRDLYLQGGNCASDGQPVVENNSGLLLGERSTIDHVTVTCFQGHGERGSITYVPPGPPRGVPFDANESYIVNSIFSYNQGDGQHTDSSNANLVVSVNNASEFNGGVGFVDTSLYGGTYISAHSQYNHGGSFRATNGTWIQPYSEGGEPLGSFSVKATVINPQGNAAIADMGAEINSANGLVVVPSHVDSGMTGSELIQANVTNADYAGQSAEAWYNTSPLPHTGRPFADGQVNYSLLSIGRRTQYGNTPGWWCDMQQAPNYNGYLWSSDFCLADKLTQTGRNQIDGQYGSAWFPNGYFEGAAGDYSPQCVVKTGGGPPTSGNWKPCDFFRNTNPANGIFGWVATVEGVGLGARWSIVPLLPSTASVRR